MTVDDCETLDSAVGPETFYDDNIVMHTALFNENDRLTKVLEDVEDPHHETAVELVCKRNSIGKSPLEIACIMGRTDVVQTLLGQESVDINQANSAGYTLPHFASCWGQIDCLKVLVQSGAALDKVTMHGESVRDVAVRYNKTHCVEYIDWAVAKSLLVSYVASVRDTLADPEKMQGIKLSKDEKNTLTGGCSELEDWAENSENPSREEFIQKKLDFEAVVDGILNKSESVPNTASSSKK